jgi:ferredoxin
MNDTLIFYFSGTGNSLVVAKKLHLKIPNSQLIPIIGFINSGLKQIQQKTIVLVFPTYLTTIPYPVRQFIQNSDFSKVSYISFVATGLGIFNLSRLAADRILKKQKKHINSFFSIKMIQNSPVGLTPAKGNPAWKDEITAEKILPVLEGIQEQVETIAHHIIEKNTAGLNQNFFAPFLETLITLLTKNANAKLPFYTDQTCNSCATCEKVCPSGKIEFSDKKPYWNPDKKCYYCYACFNFCPEQSILLPNYSEKNGRFHNPEISAEDIIKQKTFTP